MVDKKDYENLISIQILYFFPHPI